MILLVTFILCLPILALAAALHWLTGKIGWGVAGVPGWLTFLLIASLSFGGFYLSMVVDEMIVTPAKRQQEFLGRQYGGPLTLTSYEFSGFQDPGQVWRYGLSSDTLASLRKQCLTKGFENGPKSCVLFSKHDERWYGQVEIVDDQLVVHDGLW